MVLWVEPVLKPLRRARENIRAFIRYSGNNSGPHTQLTKSCEVLISIPIIVENPTDAVREKQTVPLGSNTADELAIPSGVPLWRLPKSRPAREHLRE